MKTLFTFFVIIILFSAQSGYAQITLTASDFANIYAEGNSYTTYFDMTTSSVDIGQPGGGNAWDFSNLNSSFFTVAVMVAPSSTPQSAQFPDANYATFVEDDSVAGYGTYSYYHLGNNFERCGNYEKTEIVVGTVTESESHFTPYEISTKLPLTAGTTWTQSYESVVTTTMPPLPPMNETDDVTFTRTVDAWGTMLIPGVTDPIEALRVRLDETMVTHNTGGDSYIRWISYEFITKSYTIVGITLADTLSPDSGVVDIIGGGWGVSSVTDVQDDNYVADNFKLEQNYPNPFNPTTTISYSIPVVEMGHSLPVQLKVYDMLGHQVATLVNRKQAPGKYSVKFNASKLSSGIYFYTLQTGDFIQTKKCILIK